MIVTKGGFGSRVLEEMSMEASVNVAKCDAGEDAARGPEALITPSSAKGPLSWLSRTRAARRFWPCDVPFFEPKRLRVTGHILAMAP